MSATPQSDVVIPELLQGQWTSALICTYSADVTFFETRLLSQLAQIPLRVVLADHKQLANTLAESHRTGQRHRLANKAYVAAPIRHSRAAHAKLILLLRPTTGLLIVGSGNLGYEGYAAPGELWHVYAYSEKSPRHIHEFAAARAYIDGLVQRDLIDPPVVELLQTSWGQATWLPPSPTTSTAVRNNLDRPVIGQLRDVVSEPVDEVIAHAPFHDADSAALQDLVKTFAPQHVRLLVSNATSADPAAIERVLADARKATVERIAVKSEPAAYIHAKWVHLIHPKSETLLTGSANLSRSALLRSAESGNIEIGVVSTGKHGEFDSLYRHLQRETVMDLSTLDISYQSADEGETSDANYPVVLWSRLDETTLILVFDRALPDGAVLKLQDHAGTALTWISIDIDGPTVRIDLTRESADRLSDGGKLQVRLDGDDNQISVTWPYHLTHLRSRLEKAGQREFLPRIGDLPEQDAELYELLQDLDQSLIIDRASVWRIVKPSGPPPPEPQGGEPTVLLEDLDWARVRRDPRFSGYFARGRSSGLPPTDIQVILAAIAGRLGEIGVGHPASETDGTDDLAREGDATSSDADDAEDELAKRRLPISTRTRMAFDRFTRRYAAALDDTAFIEDLGPIPAITNAAVFNHLLFRLKERNAVSPHSALDAQIKTWNFLWGLGARAGIVSALDGETAEIARAVLDNAGARLTTLRAVATSLVHATDDDDLAGLRDAARHVLTDDEFALNADQLAEATGGLPMATGLLSLLAHAASPTTSAEILDLVLAPYGIAPTAAGWRREEVRRAGRSIHRSSTFVVHAPVEGLTADQATEMLGRVAVAAYYAERDDGYYRIRFEGNGKSVAFWDDDAGHGVVLVDKDDRDINGIDRPWPGWKRKIDELESEIRALSKVARTA